MGSDIHNISVLTANLFLSCRDSHSNSCQRAIKWNGLFPAFPVYKPNWVGHDTVPLAVVCGVAGCQGTKAPAWQGHVTEQQEHLHSPGSTSKNRTGKEKQLCTVAAAEDRSLAQMWKHSCLLCSAPEWIIPINVLMILPSWQIWINAAIGSLFECPAVHRRILVYQHLQKRPRVNIEKLSASWTIYISFEEVSALPYHSWK